MGIARIPKCSPRDFSPHLSHFLTHSFTTGSMRAKSSHQHSYAICGFPRQRRFMHWCYSIRAVYGSLAGELSDAIAVVIHCLNRAGQLVSGRPCIKWQEPPYLPLERAHAGCFQKNYTVLLQHISDRLPQYPKRR